MASQVSHLAAPRNGIVPETASPPSHRGRRGKGAPAGQERLAKRLDRPNPCGGGRLCEIGLFQSSFMASASSLFSSWMSMLPIAGTRCARRGANDNGRSVLAIVASQHYVVAVRAHARICPPWAFPPWTHGASGRPSFFGDDRPGPSNREARSTAAHFANPVKELEPAIRRGVGNRGAACVRAMC